MVLDFDNQSLNIISHSFWKARLHNSWNLSIIKNNQIECCCNWK
jgi:hypothetical protein